MTIIIPNNKFLNELFPELENSDPELQKILENYYTLGNVKPKIEITEEFIKIHIDQERAKAEERKASKLIALCEVGKYEEAMSEVNDLIKEFPSASEYYRIKGQILSEAGDQEEAINSLIDALRWEPSNHWALIMMGNIFSRYRNDVDTALLYYNKAVEVNPDDYLGLNNIGAILMQQGKEQEAGNFFQKALEVNPDYGNTYLGLGLLEQANENHLQAFEYGLKAIEKSEKRDQVFQKSLDLVLDASMKVAAEPDTEEVIKNLQNDLQRETGKEIKFEEDPNIPTAAKIEYAEFYNREHHLVKYKPNYPAVSHLILHELTHLKFAGEARNMGENQLFTTNNTHKAKFLSSYSSEVSKLKKRGVPQDSIDNYFTAIFEGLNSQIFNTPIDLFIEDRIYKKYQEFRPVQFLSLLRLLREGKEATTHKNIINNAPNSVISKSKVLNLVNALLFKDLFGFDMISDFKPTKVELKQAQEFFAEFNEYRDDKAPGEEYEIIQHWGEDLALDNFFELIPEQEDKRKTVDDALEAMNRDPYGQEEEDPSNERKMKKFFNEHSRGEINMAVAMYMVTAIEYFKRMSKPGIKKIAFELATLGMTGIDPKKTKGYSVPSIEGDFSGYKILAYYYVSWALAMPEMLQSLQMPFDREYELAVQFKSK